MVDKSDAGEPANAYPTALLVDLLSANASDPPAWAFPGHRAPESTPLGTSRTA
jgi:hypothetical protein